MFKNFQKGRGTPSPHIPPPGYRSVNDALKKRPNLNTVGVGAIFVPEKSCKRNLGNWARFGQKNSARPKLEGVRTPMSVIHRGIEPCGPPPDANFFFCS